ncbi:hypothetical protein EG68_04965 [Paragonimus skrjabini miyazakii]|uniref:Peptidase S1 domain-containing protein n=1 Tax=Paragonimus skrjabini miyazakii TaxID=59628 RepID=A0A8S9YU00_9TREM|nr:hypothetical protein EG68_04965 [Paragonimus skrjabini miyazakii]
MKIKGHIPYIWGKSVPAPLPQSKQLRQWPLGGTKCTIVGWGCTRAGDHVTDIASVAKLKVLNGQTCDQFFNDVNNGHEFCAGYNNSGIGICPGDSGSGLACKHHGTLTVMGVLSGSHPKEPQNFPSVYGRVAAFIDWIQTEMRQN